MNRDSNQPKLSKRQFLFGVAAGAASLQTAHLLSTPSSRVQAKEPKSKISYSQSGEDIVVSFVFEHLGLPNPTYIDIGAYDPIDMNNTYLFHTRGGHGVLVEPNVDLIPSLKKVRPNDVVLNAGIGVDATPAADYYRLSEPSWNTFSKEQVDEVIKETAGRKDEVKLLEVVKMPLLNINDVFAEHFKGATPDFVSIDIEGLDLAILRTIDFSRHRPKVICVETLVTGTKTEKTDTGRFLQQQGYVLRGATFVNSIFVDTKILKS